MLNWAYRFNTFCFFDNHLYRIKPQTEECMLAAGVKRQLKAETGKALAQLQQFINQGAGWLFGHLGYDLKNEIENLSSSHPDNIRFPALFFFEPEILIRFNEKEMIIEATNPEKIFAEINGIVVPDSPVLKRAVIQSRISRQEYIQIIGKLKQHILRGDCYEINFCQEFFSENAMIDPVAVYQQLSRVSPNPFSALYKIPACDGTDRDNCWLICSSPERFLKKQGSAILSQPIKGTSERITNDVVLDNLSREMLSNSIKDRSENVMIVDLVRNDLAKACKAGTVRVDELFGIYSFPQVHQMISTVSGELKNGISFTDIIKATFPMGSMTGAPKKTCHGTYRTV